MTGCRFEGGLPFSIREVTSKAWGHAPPRQNAGFLPSIYCYSRLSLSPVYWFCRPGVTLCVWQGVKSNYTALKSNYLLITHWFCLHFSNTRKQLDNIPRNSATWCHNNFFICVFAAEISDHQHVFKCNRPPAKINVASENEKCKFLGTKSHGRILRMQKLRFPLRRTLSYQVYCL